MKISRRDFFIKTLQGTVIAVVPIVLSPILESCSNTVIGPSGSDALSTVQGSLSGNILTVDIGSSSPLSKSNSAALINYSNGHLLVDRTSQSNFNALSAICPHQGCLINGYDSGNNQFVCTCHGSKFDTSGHVVQGPANSNLNKYQTQFSNNQLKITI